MRFAKPFVYFSESVLTPSRTVDLIKQYIEKANGTCHVDIRTLWKSAALSVRSQAALHRLTGYKGERYHKWLLGVLDNVADGIQFPSQTSKSEFKSELMPLIGKPQNYCVPDNVKQFLDELRRHEIGCGVIANESHLYPAILKYLGLSFVSPTILSSGPTMFKPLPWMWQRAIEKAPASSKHDIWFIGSGDSPCDNMGQNPHIRCALLKPDLENSDPVSRHFRIRQLDDLLPSLVGIQVSQTLSFLNDIYKDSPDVISENDDVEVSTYLPGKLPPLEGKEPNVADVLQKHS